MRDFEADFHGLLAVLATNARVQLTPAVLAFYDRAVEPYGYEESFKALDKLAASMKNWQMPTPAQIIETINEKDRPSKVSEANEIAGRIMQAITDIGYTGSQRARTFIGEVGWEVVKRFGGWYNLCTTMGVSLDPSQSRAQMRELALSLMDISQHRSLEVAPQLPEPKQQIQSALKLLSKAKEMPK